MNQKLEFWKSHRKIADGNELMVDMINKGEVTQSDLKALIKRRPEVYGRFAGLVKVCKKETEKVWIITEWDRSTTTVLFPSDY